MLKATKVIIKIDHICIKMQKWILSSFVITLMIILGEMWLIATMQNNPILIVLLKHILKKNIKNTETFLKSKKCCF